MSIIKHFSQGNNDQEYEGLHSHWKEKEQMVPIETVDRVFDKTYDAAYNQAIQDTLSIIQKYNTGKELSPLFNQLVPKIEALVKH